MAATQRPHSAPDTRLVRPRLSDDQLATLERYGTVEPTTVGQVLFAAGDPSYDLIDHVRNTDCEASLLIRRRDLKSEVSSQPGYRR